MASEAVYCLEIPNIFVSYDLYQWFVEQTAWCPSRESYFDHSLAKCDIFRDLSKGEIEKTVDGEYFVLSKYL
jgi:hypothetical protein